MKILNARWLALLATCAGPAQAEIVEYMCGGLKLQIEFSADYKVATPLNDLSNAAIQGKMAVAQTEDSTTVSYKYLPADQSFPMTILGPSRSKVNITYGRRSFDCEAVK